MKLKELMELIQELDLDPEAEVFASNDHDEGDTKNPQSFEICGAEEAGHQGEEPALVIFLNKGVATGTKYRK